MRPQHHEGPCPAPAHVGARLFERAEFDQPRIDTGSMSGGNHLSPSPDHAGSFPARAAASRVPRHRRGKHELRPGSSGGSMSVLRVYSAGSLPPLDARIRSYYRVFTTGTGTSAYRRVPSTVAPGLKRLRSSSLARRSRSGMLPVSPRGRFLPQAIFDEDRRLFATSIRSSRICRRAISPRSGRRRLTPKKFSTFE